MTDTDRIPASSPAPAEGLKLGDRIRSTDYGPGTVVSIMGNTILVWWDTPLTGTSTHQLGHDRAYVETLERL